MDLAGLLSSGGIKTQRTQQEMEDIVNAQDELKAYSDELNKRTLADRLANQEMKAQYLGAYKPKLDLSQPLAFFSGWTGNQAPLAAYKPPQEDASQRLAMAEKLYSTDTSATDKATVDALKERLKSLMEVSKPSVGLGSLLSQERQGQRQNAYIDRGLEKDARSEVKQMNTKFSESMKPLLTLEDAVASGKLSRIVPELGNLSKASGNVGAQSDPDIARQFQQSLQSRAAEIEQFFGNYSGDDQIPKEQLKVLKDRVDNYKKVLNDLVSRNFDSAASLYEIGQGSGGTVNEIFSRGKKGFQNISNIGKEKETQKTSQTIKVSNGSETFEIPASELEAAQKDGFKRVQ